jgi:hypothetical protein
MRESEEWQHQAVARDRTTEWFVPRFGPPKFRAFIGLLFLPYTGMVLSYTVIGAMLAPQVDWERVAAMLLIYFLALGFSAHAFDALGSRAVKPWGNFFSVRQLWLLGVGALVAAYAIAGYYMTLYAPLMWPVAIAEGFFLLAYNLEWFGGRFHTDGYFALSWGALPVIAGYVMQTNTMAVSAVLMAGATAMLSLVEIRASRPYKEWKRTRLANPAVNLGFLEGILKCISGGVLLLGISLAAVRWIG